LLLDLSQSRGPPNLQSTGVYRYRSLPKGGRIAKLQLQAKFAMRVAGDRRPIRKEGKYFVLGRKQIPKISPLLAGIFGNDKHVLIPFEPEWMQLKKYHMFGCWENHAVSFF